VSAARISSAAFALFSFQSTTNFQDNQAMTSRQCQSIQLIASKIYLSGLRRVFSCIPVDGNGKISFRAVVRHRFGERIWSSRSTSLISLLFLDTPASPVHAITWNTRPRSLNSALKRTNSFKLDILDHRWPPLPTTAHTGSVDAILCKICG